MTWDIIKISTANIMVFIHLPKASGLVVLVIIWLLYLLLPVQSVLSEICSHSLFMPFGFLAPKTELFGFQIFSLRAYLIKVIPKHIMHTKLDVYVFY